MSYIVRQRIKGQIYLYEATAYWDSTSQKAKQKRHYLGKEGKDGRPLKPREVFRLRSVKTLGTPHVLNVFAERCGLTAEFAAIFGERHRDILNLLFFKILTGEPYYLFRHWAEGVELFGGEPLSSQEISRLTRWLGQEEELHAQFFRHWCQRHHKTGVLIFDITSISSYAKLNDWLAWGYNRDGEQLPQINLGAIISQDLGLPLAYTLYQGSIPDVVTLKNVVTLTRSFGFKSFLYVLDRGFYSAANVQNLVAQELDFIIPFPFSTKQATTLVAQTKEQLEKASNAFRFGDSLMYHYCTTATIEKLTLHAHVLLSVERQKLELASLMFKLEEIETRGSRLKSKKAIEEFFEQHAASYRKFFTLNKSHLIRNEASLATAISHFGKMILLTTKPNLTKYQILEHYSKRDLAEKYFTQMKTELGDHRLRVSEHATFSGRLFLTYLALILRTFLASSVQKSKDLKHYSIPEIFSQLNLIRRVSGTSEAYITEISKLISENG
jgi:transposase